MYQAAKAATSGLISMLSAYRDSISSMASRGSMRGPGLASTDLSLGKRFFIAEGKSLQLRWETYNTFNRTNMANPNTSIDAGPNNAGRITGLLVGTTMRAMQLGMRLEF